jgi:hypothetical protein
VATCGHESLLGSPFLCKSWRVGPPPAVLLARG